MALKGPKMSKQGTVGKRKHVTSLIPQKREMIIRFESGEGEERLWLLATLDCQLFMIYRIGRTNYDHLWHQLKVWTFSSNRY